MYDYKKSIYIYLTSKILKDLATQWILDSCKTSKKKNGITTLINVKERLEEEKNYNIEIQYI